VMEYSEFLRDKSHLKHEKGFKPLWIPDFLFDFQKDMTEWNIIKGRSAMFEDCGLGKTPQFLVWAQNVVMQTNKPVIILTPLSVAQQVVKEGEKFGVDCEQSKDGKYSKKIVVTNYERLHFFDSSDFQGIVCDESSILKNFAGQRKAQITDFAKKMPYRLLSTATAAPNDYIELGTSSEALGAMGYMDMLNMFFKNDQNNSSTGRHYGKKIQWRLKKPAEKVFWRWVTSWARAIRKPSDLGFNDGKFILPELIEEQHLIDATTPPPGELFMRPAIGLKEQREELKATVRQRCEKVAELVDHKEPFLVWCHLNDEGDLLEKLLPNALQVAGKHSDDEKERRLNAFSSGEIQGMITKPKIAGFGMNWQHCAHMTFFPSNSYEQYYQGVRRCWRFGQDKPVKVDMVTTHGMETILNNLQNKSNAADKMFSMLVSNMNDSLKINTDINFNQKMEVPEWAA
jgi:hypothetical protein